jgi:hypothetical protein
LDGGGTCPVSGDQLGTGLSDGLVLRIGDQITGKFWTEAPGEPVNESLDLTAVFTFAESIVNSDFVYLIEPTQPFKGTDPNVSGIRSDDLRFGISHETGSSATTFTVTLNSDEEHQGDVKGPPGYLETGFYQDVTASFFTSGYNPTTHLLTNSTGETLFVQVLVASDVEGAPVPEPTSILLLGTGLGIIGLAVWRRTKQQD